MEYQFDRVSVIGLGYIGLPTAAVIANRGVDVIGIDVNAAVVDQLNKGDIHIVEPGLDVLVRGAVHSGKFRASLTPEPAQAFLVAVPTPFKDDYQPDLAYVEAAAKSIAPVLRKGALVILESTSPVGTTLEMAAWLSAARPDLVFPHQTDGTPDVFIAYCPERVLPGQVLRELVENDRVIGGITPECAKRARSLYKIFVQGECVLTDSRTAEMTKLTENAFRDVNIAFANELSLVCEKLGIDVWELIALANRHPRVNILKPGPGVGGHCIAVDPWFIISSAPDTAHLMRTARQVNDGKPGWVVDRVRAAAMDMKHPRVACLGLSFKANIDDLRESPALHIVEDLAQRGLGELLVVEPHVDVLPRSLRDLPQVSFVGLQEALSEANIVVCLVDHDQFKDVEPAQLDGKVVIDTRGLWRHLAASQPGATVMVPDRALAR